jgi:hypothetical protein
MDVTAQSALISRAGVAQWCRAQPTARGTHGCRETPVAAQQRTRMALPSPRRTAIDGPLRRWVPLGAHRKTGASLLGRFGAHWAPHEGPKARTAGGQSPIRREQFAGGSLRRRGASWPPRCAAHVTSGTQAGKRGSWVALAESRGWQGHEHFARTDSGSSAFTHCVTQARQFARGGGNAVPRGLVQPDLHSHRRGDPTPQSQQTQRGFQGPRRVNLSRPHQQKSRTPAPC